MNTSSKNPTKPLFRTVPPALQTLSRVAAAVAGGYALAAAGAIFLAAVLPGGRADGVMAGMQFSFAIHTAAAIWAFSPISTTRVWGGLALLSAALLGLGWLQPVIARGG
ncbi:hypothetical protein BH10PSE18_BH10PSE18_20940 [soil metagenome]